MRVGWIEPDIAGLHGVWIGRNLDKVQSQRWVTGFQERTFASLATIAAPNATDHGRASIRGVTHGSGARAAGSSPILTSSAHSAVPTQEILTGRIHRKTIASDVNNSATTVERLGRNNQQHQQRQLQHSLRIPTHWSPSWRGFSSLLHSSSGFKSPNEQIGTCHI